MEKKECMPGAITAKGIVTNNAWRAGETGSAMVRSRKEEKKVILEGGEKI